LAPANICDLLLNLAEAPRLYLPVWSEDILAEVRRTHIARLGFSEQLADSWQDAVRRSFPEAIIKGHEPLVASCQNHEKDRQQVAVVFPQMLGLRPHAIRANGVIRVSTRCFKGDLLRVSGFPLPTTATSSQFLVRSRPDEF
jgi:hypothetical protein